MKTGAARTTLQSVDASKIVSISVPFAKDSDLEKRPRSIAHEESPLLQIRQADSKNQAKLTRMMRVRKMEEKGTTARKVKMMMMTKKKARTRMEMSLLQKTTMTTTRVMMKKMKIRVILGHHS